MAVSLQNPVLKFLSFVLQNYVKRAASVTVREEWKVLDEGEMDFPRLSKLNLPNIDDPVDL